jgi:predicted dehydrogenase
VPPVIPTPRLIPPNSAPPLRWGIVGTGWIAGQFVGALHAHTAQRAVGVSARDETRTRAFAASHEIDRVYATVSDLVADPGIDVVYIATPHASHAEHALAAIADGKHVLIEKPMAMSGDQAEQIATAARTKGVFAMEAMWTRYLPQTDVIRQILAADTIGEVHLVTADFGFIAPFMPEHRIWNPALGGGALLDAGVYPLSFSSFVLGTPSLITAVGGLTSTGVDAEASILLASPSGAASLIAASIVSALPARASIVGSLGRIDVHSPMFGQSGLTLTTGSVAAEESTWVDDTFATTHEALSYQATALATYVGEGRTESPLHTLDETIAILRTIDEALSQVRNGKAAAPAPERPRD